MKKILILLMCMLIPSLVNASDYKSYSLTPSINNNYQGYEYVIDEYHVEINVNEDNTYDITEEITAYYNVAKHGIIRKIPLKNTVKRLDGTQSTNRARVTDLYVNEEYSKSTSNNNLEVKIGDANYTITGEKEYEIRYTYNIGKDKSKDYDELYFNLIGTEWDTAIGNVTFTINMPKEFDESKLGFSAGSYGSGYNDNISFEVDGNTITGSYNDILNSYEGLTVRLELPEGYYVQSIFYVVQDYLYIGLPIILLLISFVLWNLFGKNKVIVDTVEFYPPEGFNSLETAFIYNGKAKAKDVTSLLIYLANKGYLKIEESEEKTLFSKTFKLIKLKDYDGNNEYERIFMNGLFSLKNEVTQSDLYNSFYLTMNRILKEINNKDNKSTILDEKAGKKRIFIVLMMIITIITIIVIPTMSYAGIAELFMTLGITLFYVPFYAVGIFSKAPKSFKLFWLGFTICHSAIFFSTMPIKEALFDNQFYLFGFITGILCIAGMSVILKNMKKRTSYGVELYGRIKGFKNFLETAEKDRLEAQVATNPTYFYDILPYTYVLGISDKWIEKFETINLQAPEWYNDNSSTFDVKTFNTFVNATMSSAQKSMTSQPNSSGSYGGSSGSSGGFSGGGSSGGGSGGGGGSSW